LKVELVEQEAGQLEEASWMEVLMEVVGEHLVEEGWMAYEKVEEGG
jgi:hypothetical protein